MATSKLSQYEAALAARNQAIDAKIEQHLQVRCNWLQLALCPAPGTLDQHHCHCCCRPPAGSRQTHWSVQWRTRCATCSRPQRSWTLKKTGRRPAAAAQPQGPAGERIRLGGAVPVCQGSKGEGSFCRLGHAIPLLLYRWAADGSQSELEDAGGAAQEGLPPLAELRLYKARVKALYSDINTLQTQAKVQSPAPQTSFNAGPCHFFPPRMEGHLS